MQRREGCPGDTVHLCGHISQLLQQEKPLFGLSRHNVKRQLKGDGSTCQAWRWTVKLLMLAFVSQL